MSKKFDAQYSLLEHINQVQALGKGLLRASAEILQCSNPEDLSTATNFNLAEEDFKQLTSAFTSLSSQITSLSRIYSQVRQQDRQRHLEALIIQVLKELDPKTAKRFVDELEVRAGGSELDTSIPDEI
jgi:hypothetical protein